MNKLLTEKESFKIGLEPFKNSHTHFLHFGHENRVGINPKYRYSTPIGVYGYMASDIYPNISTSKEFFGHTRSLCHVLELTTKHLLILQDFKFKDNIQQIKEIYRKYTPNKNVSLSDTLSRLKNLKDEYTVESQGDLLWKLLYHCVTPHDKKISTDANIPTKRSTVLMNKILRELGYEAVLDTKGAIHKMQTTQIIFLTRNSYKHIKTIEQFNK